MSMKWLQKIRDIEESKRRENIFAHQMLEFFTKKARNWNFIRYQWINETYYKSFELLKDFDHQTKVKVNKLENDIEQKFMQIESEIEEKIGIFKKEIAKGYDDIRELYPIFDDFTIEPYYGKPLKEQNKINLMWHDFRQTIAIQLEEISDHIGVPFHDIPWDSQFCNACNIYWDPKTETRYSPPRFSYQLDPNIKLPQMML